MALVTKPKPGTETVGDAIKKLSTATKNFWVSNPKSNANSSTGLIAYYWIKAGGNPQRAPEAVAAALAESSGNAGAVSAPNTDGSHDVGYWQINSSHGPQMATTDPLSNARAAVELSHNGTDWSAWCTSYDDGTCHGSMSDAHYRGPGLGKYASGAPVLSAAALAFLYAKDAVAGAIYGAQNVGGLATPLEGLGDPVTQVGAGATDSLDNATQNHINSLTGGAWGTGSIGTILAYIGYVLLAAFGATLMLAGLAILVLALVEKQGALAAVPGVGRVAGAASEVNGAITARSVRNQERGASSARRSRVVRRMHGESGKAPKSPAPTHGGTPQRRARRTHDAGVNPRARYPHKGTTRSNDPAPF